jgi:hypothetical protein
MKKKQKRRSREQEDDDLFEKIKQACNRHPGHELVAIWDGSDPEPTIGYLPRWIFAGLQKRNAQ